jgi:hypothetical protein
MNLLVSGRGQQQAPMNPFMPTSVLRQMMNKQQMSEENAKEQHAQQSRATSDGKQPGTSCKLLLAICTNTLSCFTLLWGDVHFTVGNSATRRGCELQYPTQTYVLSFLNLIRQHKTIISIYMLQC